MPIDRGLAPPSAAVPVPLLRRAAVPVPVFGGVSPSPAVSGSSDGDRHQEEGCLSPTEKREDDE
jgi:hypothetical protein